MDTGVCAVRDLVPVPERSSTAGAQQVLVALVTQAGSCAGWQPVLSLHQVHKKADCVAEDTEHVEIE